MRTKFLASLMILACLGLAGCKNTVHGAGEDISKAGNKISNSTR